MNKLIYVICCIQELNYSETVKIIISLTKSALFWKVFKIIWVLSVSWDAIDHLQSETKKSKYTSYCLITGWRATDVSL